MQYHSMDKTEQQTTNTNVNQHYDMAKLVAILSYLTIIGWLLAIACYGKHRSEFTSFHLRQSLGLIVTGALLALIPLIGWLLNVAICIAWLYSIFYVVQGQQKKVPILGDFYQSHLDFIK